MHNEPGGPPPVFVDGTGQRRRLTVIAGTAMGFGLLVSLGLIAAGLFMDSSVSLPGWSENRAPIEAEVDDGGELGGGSPAVQSPAPVTSTAVPLPTSSRSAATTATTAPPGTPAAGQPTSSEPPGQGDDRRSTAKPSRSPGKPR
ncbi:hypothetical protein [Micromonospora sp. NPDC049497]|uniref:hypothetical protein n=1 Tax=Micromonospora sp. NPDC049497 TaxID=3364273 RepID=UPI00378F9CB5